MLNGNLSELPNDNRGDERVIMIVTEELIDTVARKLLKQRPELSGEKVREEAKELVLLIGENLSLTLFNELAEACRIRLKADGWNDAELYTDFAAIKRYILNAEGKEHEQRK